MNDLNFSLQGKRVWVAGHGGLVGSAILRRLNREPVGELVTASSTEVDLRRQDATEAFVREVRPDVLILAAARVGGINANQNAQGEFLYDNLMIAANSIQAARMGGIERTVVLGSSCIYPRHAPQPICESHLLTGPLEPTNEGYAIAKIAALEMSKMYRRQYGMSVVSLMPTNLYGPGDNFNLETSHVLPALIRRFDTAKRSRDATVTLWGTGTPRREFLHVDDLAEAVVHVLENYDEDSHLNVGTGVDISIRSLSELVAGVVGWEGQIRYDSSMPDGTPRKLLDVSKIHATGWKHSIELSDGLAATYQWYSEAFSSL